MTYSRREILAFLGVSALAFNETISAVKAQSNSIPGSLDVAIVGAGSAGLTAGFLLDQAGAKFKIFEAAEIHGGRARKDDSLTDYPLDMGGEWVHTSNQVLNRLSGTKHAAARAIEFRPKTCDVWDGKNRYSANHFAYEWRGEHRFTTTTWFDFFNDFMAKPIRDRIALNSQVKEINYAGDLVSLKLANGEKVTARHVIVTVPLNVLKDGDIKFRPALPRAKKRVMKKAFMPDGFKLFMRFSERFYPDLVYFDHKYETDVSEMIFYNSALDKNTNDNVLGFFGHGALAKPWVKLEEWDFVKSALNLLDEIYDGAASPSYEGHVLRNWSKSPFHRGTYSFFKGVSPATLGKSIARKVHFAGEAYNRRRDGEWGYMHVASRSAYDAVKEIARR